MKRPNEIVKTSKELESNEKMQKEVDISTPPIPADFLFNLRGTAYDKSIDSCHLINQNGIILDANEAFSQLTGYSTKEVIGMSALKLIHEENIKAVNKDLAKLKSTNKAINWEVIVIRKDGKKIPILESATLIYQNKSSSIYFVHMKDITEHYYLKQKIEANEQLIEKQLNDLRKFNISLQESESKFRSLYEESPELHRTVNTDGIILDCNKKYAEMLGYSKEEVIGKTIFDHVDLSELPAMRESFETWKNTGRVLNREVWLKRIDGSTFPTLISASNLYDLSGKLIGSNTIITDISKLTELRRQLEAREKTIREQYLQLKKSSKAKDVFTSMITHELKTPLVPIKSYIEMILAEQFGPINKEQRNKLELVISNTKNLERIVSDFLDVVKIELDQLKLTKDVYDLSEIIKEVVTQLEPSAHDKGLTIKTNLQNNILCSCDKTRIEQVILNLVTNSIKFSKGKIAIKLHKKDPYAKIVVKDEGIGIKKDRLEKVFVKFYQINTSSTRERSGTGLGLSVCKGIIESHFGRIWAESEGEDKGVEIHIQLPLSERLS